MSRRATISKDRDLIMTLIDRGVAPKDVAKVTGYSRNAIYMFTYNQRKLARQAALNAEADEAHEPAVLADDRPVLELTIPRDVANFAHSVDLPLTLKISVGVA